MKQLLMKRKKAFAFYLLACFFPVINQLMSQLGFALMIGTVESQSMNQFTLALAVTAGIVVASSLLQLLSRFMRIRFMRDTLLDIRLEAFDKILSETVASFSKKSKEVYLSHLINDINTFEQHFFHRLLNIIFGGGVYVFSIIILMFLDFWFAIGILAVSLGVFAITKTFESKTVALQQQVSELNEQLTVKVSNTFNGLEILKLNNIEEKFLGQTFEAVDHVEKKRFHYTVFTEGQRGLTNSLSFIIFIGILMVLMLKAFDGTSIGKITFMLQLANGCVWPIGQVVPMFNELKASIGIYQKITGTQAGSPEGAEQTSAEQVADVPFAFHHEIKIRDLAFAYDGKVVLDGANFVLQKGKKYLVKGPSGSGKTTLLKLLSKVYEDYDGQITVDGLDYKKVDINSFNHKISNIYQDVFLFEDTLLNNITLFKPMDHSKVEEAVERAGLSELISTRAEGLQMKIEENGKNLSGGQRQRIAIARAILRDSEILFADEATSSLNEQLGRAIEETLLKLDSTVIAISHRFYEGITEKYDAIIEIKNGVLHEYDSKVYFSEGVAL